MKQLLSLTALTVFTCAAAIAQGNNDRQLVMDRTLPSNGTVVLDMNVGDVKIIPSTTANQLRLEIHADSQYDQQALASWVKRFDVTGERATINIQVPKGHNHNSNFSMVLYVPVQSALKADLSVGDLTIQGIRGDKEVHVGIGDLRIGYHDPAEYAHVETSTHIGDIGDPLRQGGESGFLGKSEDFTKQGRFHLRASVGIGDLKLFDEGQS
jgi:hypothetical protein